jgi:hypothetical protein
VHVLNLALPREEMVQAFADVIVAVRMYAMPIDRTIAEEMARMTYKLDVDFAFMPQNSAIFNQYTAFLCNLTLSSHAPQIRRLPEQYKGWLFLTQRPFFVCVPPEYHTAILFWLDDQYTIAEASHLLVLILHS